MKSLKTVLSYLVLLLITNLTLQAQHKTHEGVLDDMTLSIKALEVLGVDKSNHLSKVIIKEKTWTEIDPNGMKIGQAHILHNKHNEIKVKWISASNGAQIDAVTIYKIVKEEGSYTFHIYFDDDEQGHFNAVKE